MQAQGEKWRQVMSWVVISTFLVVVMVPSPVIGARNCSFPAIFNFGDSNSDTGGLSAAFGQAPPPNGITFFHTPAGRFSDGRLIIDFLAQNLSLPYLSAYLDSVGSNFSNGANFATAGSTVRPQNTTKSQSGYSPISLDVQLIQYSDFKARSILVRKKGGVFMKLLPKEVYFSEALYTFDIGQNDLTAGYKLNMTTEQVKAYIPDVLGQFSDVIRSVYKEGGRSFWIHNTGPLGCLPYTLDRYPMSAAQMDKFGCAKPFNEVAQYFNSRLKETVVQLRKEVPEATIVYVDVYTVKYNLISHAKKYGFEKGVIACCGQGGKYNFNNVARCGGKSTLARAIYNFLGDQFDGLCFLHDVRENSAKNNLKHLQEKLLLKTIGLEIKLDHVSEGIPIIKERLCRKKILLILDDVDNMNQLYALAGGLDWFGRGSRVIITTRDKHLLSSHGIKSTHAVEGLNGTEALELLRWMAFKSDKVPSGYEDILNRAVAYASGLPLVIEVVGSNLFGKSIEKWKSTLDGYDKIPNKEIQKILKVSYDALEEEEQSVFLDIACCFKGCGWADVKDILHAHYGHCITHHLEVLAEKSLINRWEYDGCVGLHDLIEDMGKEVVRQESPKEPGERSRLWCQDDIVHALNENTGTSKIEMIYMNFHSMESVIDQKGMAFKKMTKLKTLIIENGHFSNGLKYLPNSLRVLKWKGCLLESLSSSILSKKFQNMKVLTLDDCEYLTHIPDVSGLSNLEKFSFKFCRNLITIDNSIGHQNKLEFISAIGCSKLKRFPPLGLASLKELELSFCESLNSFPELLCKMTNIKRILFVNTSIEELPSSFQNLSELNDISIERCGKLRFRKHNDKINSLVFSNVTQLSLQNCNLSDECLPILLKWFVNVKRLDLSHNFNFNILPEFLNECHLMKIFEFDCCKSLEEIRGIPPNLEELSAYKCESLSSSSRRMLMSQKVHEAGGTEFYFPNGTDGIPNWFEHQIRGQSTISFWFRKKIPSITSILLSPEHWLGYPKVNIFVNGYEIEIDITLKFGISDHTLLFDLKLEEHNKRCKRIYGIKYESEMNKALLENEWIRVELELKSFNLSEEEKNEMLRSAQMGIHVLKEKNNAEEANVIFTDPYRETKSQKKRKQNMFSILMEYNEL